VTSPAPWATADDVLNITGKTVDQGVVGQAIGVIEMKAGRTVETALRLTSASKEWLRRAVAYQAAWMADPSNADLLARLDVTGISQDGVSATGSGADWQFVAPLARMALKRVRWRGTRSIDLVPAIGDRVVGPFGTRRYAAGVGPVFDYEGDVWRGL
jgi:hypothetical protein